jgi:F-type H+-transporting ATPase subunit b
MQIEWWTLALQAVNFLVLVWLLRRFLYRPVREVIEKRRALSEEAFAKAAAKEAEAEALKSQMAAERTAMAEERQAMLKNLHEEIGREREALLAQSRDEAAKLIAEARVTIVQERQAALSGAEVQVAGLAAELAGRLLGQVEACVPAEAYLAKLEEQLQAMTAQDLDELKRDLAGDGAVLVVATAHPLAAAAQEAWRRRLGVLLGAAGTTAFETDPDLIGGAELRLPHATVKFTWADQLRKARKVLLGDQGSA